MSAGRAGGAAAPAGAAPAGAFTAMTHNVGNGLAPPAALAAALCRSGADIVGLVELADAQAVAVARLTDRYPYQALYPSGIPGKGLLSRFPITATRQLDLFPARPDLHALVEVDGRALTVIVAHPLPPRFHRRGFSFLAGTRAQLARLTALATAGGPTLLVGDFNLTDRHPLYRSKSAAGLVDAFQAAGSGRGYTFPARLGPLPCLPLLRLDYIWHTRHLRATACWIGEAAGSDHRPVLARLAWATPRG